MSQGRDYTSHSFLLAAAVIGLLLLMGLVPPFSVGGVNFKRINILSDIYARQGDDAVVAGEYADTSFTAESLLAVAPGRMDQAHNMPLGASQYWDVGPGGFSATTEATLVAAGQTFNAPDVRASIETFADPATRIEDFSADGNTMNAFYDVLGRGHEKRPVRIAVLGDSFIEADIITADMREQLQSLYGGEGPGFVPFSSPQAKYRGTVKQTFQGWETYNVIKKKNAPATVQDKFFVSGNVCIPSDGGWVRIEGTTFRNNLKRSSVARLLFTNQQKSTLDVTVNDTVRSRFTPESSPLVQQIILRGDIYSIKVRVNAPAGFTGYGLVLESPQGVAVDNYSVRSNSGMALFGTNSSVNAQIGRLLGYDLIILQYGLNAMSPNVLNYNSYSAQLTKVISYVRDCFPGASIVVMSVGDRSTQQSGEYVTMPAVKAMISAQKKAAEQSGVAFWNTFEAMGGEKSMVKFVENKWASKDYTHIGYPGGKYIATQFVRSLIQGYKGYRETPAGKLSSPRRAGSPARRMAPVAGDIKPYIGEFATMADPKLQVRPPFAPYAKPARPARTARQQRLQEARTGNAASAETTAATSAVQQQPVTDTTRQ